MYKQRDSIFRARVLGRVINAVLLTGAMSGAAMAQSSGFGPTEFAPSTDWLTNGKLNHWYVSRSETSVGAGVDMTESGGGTSLDDGQFVDLGLARTVSVNPISDYSSASALSRVAAGKLGVVAQARSGTLDDDLTAGFSFATISYVALMDKPGAVTLDLHLTGSLSQDGNAFKRSLSGVAVVAIGSGADAPDLGLDQDDAFEALLAWPNISQRNFVTASEKVVAGDPSSDSHRQVDRHLSVTADGAAMACTALAPDYCGKYLYAFNLAVYAGARNGATADFADTLSIDAIHLPPGATLEFEPGQSIPTVAASVPEASTTTMLLLGLGLFAGSALRKRLTLG